MASNSLDLIVELSKPDAVEDKLLDVLEDEGMGSLLFQPGSSITRFGAAKRYFLDEDGLLVQVLLNTTEEGKPVELEIKKVDSAYLRRWPSESEIFETPPDQ